MENIILKCKNTESGQICVISTQEPLFTPFFSSGDIMISILILLLVFFELVKLLRGGINSVEVKRIYQGNNSPDGKEFYKI